MKKIMLLALLTFSTFTFAQGHGHGHGHGHKGGYWARSPGGWNWMIPTIIGGAIVYEVARQQPIYVQQQPVIIQQSQPVIAQPLNQTCSPWTETQNLDGTITRTRTCSQ